MVSNIASAQSRNIQLQIGLHRYYWCWSNDYPLYFHYSFLSLRECNPPPPAPPFFPPSSRRLAQNSQSWVNATLVPSSSWSLVGIFGGFFGGRGARLFTVSNIQPKVILVFLFCFPPPPGTADHVHVSTMARASLGPAGAALQSRGSVVVPGMGVLHTYWCTGRGLLDQFLTFLITDGFTVWYNIANYRA